MKRRSHPLAVTLALPLLLAPVACKRSAAVPDDALATAVQSRIQADSALATEPIQTGALDGVITLSGTVSSQAARSLASNDAAAVQGVRTVINNLTVADNTASQPPVSAPETPAPVAPSATAPSISTRERAREQAREQAAARREAERDRNAAKLAQTTPPVAVAPTPSAAIQAPVRQAAPPPPPAPVVRTVTVPTGTVLPIRISQTLDSASTQEGQSFSGSLASDLILDGTTVLRQGANVSGRVTTVQEAAHFKGNSLLTVELTGITRRGDRMALTTEPYSVEGKGRGKNTLAKTGGGAAVGAILGGIFGGGKGAAIGAAAGGGAGAGVNAITRGQQVQIPAESLIRFRLASPFNVRVTENGSSTSSGTSDNSNSSSEGRRPLQPPVQP